MPTVLRERGYRVGFYSSEPDEPAHVHVHKAGCEAKFWLAPVQLSWNKGFRETELREILRILGNTKSNYSKLGMKPNNNPPPDVATVKITTDRLTFDLEDGRSVSVPLAFYPTLMLASPKERADYEICHSSVHWPKLDCDISSDCLLRGAREARKYAQKAWRRRAQATTAQP